jgi:hypothetical protein
MDLRDAVFTGSVAGLHLGIVWWTRPSPVGTELSPGSCIWTRFQPAGPVWIGLDYSLPGVPS